MTPAIFWDSANEFLLRASWALASGSTARALELLAAAVALLETDAREFRDELTAQGSH